MSRFRKFAAATAIGLGSLIVPVAAVGPLVPTTFAAADADEDCTEYAVSAGGGDLISEIRIYLHCMDAFG